MGFIIEAIAFLVRWILPLVGAVSVGEWVVHKSSSTSTGGTGSGSTNGTNVLGTVRFVAVAAIVVGGIAFLREYLRVEDDLG